MVFWDHIGGSLGDVVGRSRSGYFVVVETMIAWWLFVSLVISVAFVDYLLQGRRDELSLAGLQDYREGVLLDRMKSLRQRRRHPQVTCKRLYHLR